MRIKIQENKELEISIKYNKEVYNNIQKGFYLYVSLYEITQEVGYVTRRICPTDNTNFKKLLESCTRYNAKKESLYNSFLEANKEKLKNLYVENKYSEIIQEVLMVTK